MYFPKPDMVRKWWDNQYIERTKQEQLPLISRDDPQSKMNDFDDMSDKLILVLDHLEWMSGSEGGLFMNIVYESIVKPRKLQIFLLFATSLLLNISFLVYVDRVTLQGIISGA